MATTKANFRLRVARHLGLVTEITTSSDGHASGHTFIAEELLDNFPTNLSELWVYAPALAESRRVVNYDEPEGIAQVNRPFSTQIADAATLYVFRRFSPSDYDEALQIAVEEAYPYLVQEVVDTSLTTVASQYEYTIPSTIHDLERMYGGKVEIEVNDTATYPYTELRHWDTRTVRTTGTQSYTLVLSPQEFDSGKTLRLSGWGPLAYPATDADTIPLDSPQINLLVFKVIEILYARAQGAPAGDSQVAMQKEGEYRAKFEQKKDEWGILLDPTDVKPPTAGFDLNLPIAYNAGPS